MKRITMILAACLLAASAMAQPADKYAERELAQKVTNMQTLEWGKIPYPFVYTEKLEWTDNQPQINIFYKAKHLYEKNPGNFAAVYNYATLIMSNDFGEGLMIWDAQIDEAYRLLEEAKKLRPDFQSVYKQQLYLLDFKLFGPVWAGPGLTEEDMLAAYRAHPDLARKQLALYQTMMQKWPSSADAYSVQSCYLICLSLNRAQSAAAYKAQYEKLETERLLAERAARKAAQEKSERLLRESLYKASFAGRY